MPALSVIIPTYQRRDGLASCLNALARQTLEPRHFEVIVVVDGSVDGTLEFLEDQAPPFTLRAIWQENLGQGAARNHGANEATGGILVLIDDDVVADPTLLEAHLALQTEHDGVVGIGNIVYGSDANDWYARAYAANWNRRFDSLADRNLNWQDLYSGNISIPRELFHRVGGFPTDRVLAEDAELGCRLQEVGAAFVYVPGAIVRHRNSKPRSALIAETETQGAACYALSERFEIARSDLSAAYHSIRPHALLHFRIAYALRTPGEVLGTLPIGFVDSQRASWQWKIQQYVFWASLKRAAMRNDRHFWRNFTRGVPILAYHAFTAQSHQASRFVVSADDFEAQMQYLCDSGYHVISLREFAALRRDNRLPPPNTVVATFDDGYADFADIAWPTMRARGFTGTLFVVTGHAGARNTWDSDSELCNRELLSWADLRQLAEGGLEIGAHTRTHPNLTASSDDELQREVQGASDDLAKELGRKPGSFAFPFGEYNTKVVTALSHAGYEAACTVQPGLNAPHIDALELRRIEIFGTDSLWRFKLKLRYGARRPKAIQLLRSD
jgi:glycosyltransferase involved in cell wall biosynthesis/peptidoglycan/xylan/chitin deacetylase (PgdA/CDA1 family)